MKPPINIYSGSSIAFAAALTNPTELAKTKGKITRSYPISLRGNPYRPARPNLRVEQYRVPKPAGEPFVSAEDAYQHFKQNLDNDAKFELMIEILSAKLTQYPVLTETITKSGGLPWLKRCSHQPNGYENFWTGTGYASGFISALAIAYRQIANLEIDNIKRTIEAVEETPEGSNKHLKYDPVTWQLYVYFSHKAKAEEWGQHLAQELYVGEGYSIENSNRSEKPFALVVSMVDKVEAEYLSRFSNFSLAPSKYNPRHY